MREPDVWSKTLLTTYYYLPKAVKSAEVKITNYPFTQGTVFQDAVTVCKTIQRLTDNRSALINAKIIVDSIMDKLPKTYRDFLYLRYIKHTPFEEVASFLGISRSTAYRKNNEAVAAFASILENSYKEAEYFCNVFEAHPFLGEAYRIIRDNERRQRLMNKQTGGDGKPTDIAK